MIRNHFFRDELPALKEAPGIWILLQEFTNKAKAEQLAHNLRSGNNQVPPGTWEFASRTDDKGSYLWGRYICENEEPVVLPGLPGRRASALTATTAPL
jgi:hypothetical protein